MILLDASTSLSRHVTHPGRCVAFLALSRKSLRTWSVFRPSAWFGKNFRLKEE